MEKTIIEVNGVKMEVDLRNAKRIDTLQVGDRVKVLIKTYSDYKVFAGTVIGFEPFKLLPTVIIAYLDIDYNSANIKFVYFNAQTKETEVVKAIDDDCLDIDKASILQRFDREIEKKREEVADLEAKRNYFLSNFRAYWPEMQSIEPMKD